MCTLRKKLHILTMTGIGIYVIYSFMDRFMYEFSDKIELPLVVTSMSMVVLGALIQQRK